MILFNIKIRTLDIKSWFGRADREFRDAPGATAADFQRLQKGCDQRLPEVHYFNKYVV